MKKKNSSKLSTQCLLKKKNKRFIARKIKVFIKEIRQAKKPGVLVI